MKPCKMQAGTMAESVAGWKRAGAARRWWGAIFLAASMGVAGPGAQAAGDKAHVLEAIHLVENPNNVTKVGRRGELGPFQFRPAVWQMYTNKPFELAADRDEAYAVAEKHYEWISAGLKRNGLEPTPYYVALAWNAGLRAAVGGRAPGASKRYAARVENLVNDFKRQAVANGG